MKGKKIVHDNYVSPEVRSELNRAKKREQYYERYVRSRLVFFSEYADNSEKTIEETLYREDDFVEGIFEHNQLIDALHSALVKLPADEMKIIQDSFFYVDNKPSQRELAAELGISRQAYDKRLRRILNKLKIMVEMYINKS